MATSATLEQIKSVEDLGGGAQTFRLVVTVTSVSGPDPAIVGYDFDEKELLVFEKAALAADDIYRNIASLGQRGHVTGLPIGRDAVGVDVGDYYRIDTATIDTESAKEFELMCARQLTDLQQLVDDWQTYAAGGWDTTNTTPVANA